MDRIRKGRFYFEMARNFLNCDLERAFRDREWGTVVRRAQESTEFAIKAVWLICGEVPRKVHTPGIREILSRVRPFIFGREDDLVLEKKPFIIRRDKTGDLILIKEDKGVHTELVRAGPGDPLAPFGLRVKDNAIIIFHGDQEVGSSSDVRGLDPGFSEHELEPIAQIAKKLGKVRDSAFYLEKQFSQANAEKARKDASTVLQIISQILGVQVDE